MRDRPTVLDLFCGCGGLSLGLQRSGLRVVAAYDHWEAAVRTYSENFQHPVERVELDETLALPRASVIVGGPPCQGFSSAGMRKSGDQRNSLVGIFSRLIVRNRPEAFVFENVEGFLTVAEGAYVMELLTPLVDAGYRIHLRKVNAANYGVPQHRKRVIAIGGLGWTPSFPAPTHAAYGAPGATLANVDGRPPTPSISAALAGLPRARRLRPLEDSSSDHSFSPLTETDLERALALAPGQCMRDLPEELHHVSYRRRAYRRVMDGTPTERRGGAPAGLRRLRADEPSKAITGGAFNEFLHPKSNRPLTLRECARLQTFPDSFRFKGTQREKIQLIGNAVPPLLAEKIGRSLVADLGRSGTRRRSLCSGALVSFLPTLSSGMSPALQAVVARVSQRFRPGSACSFDLWR